MLRSGAWEGQDRPEVAMFRNTMPRYEILSPDAIGVLDRGWRRIVSEIGVQFAKPEALELFRRAGQKVEDEVVFGGVYGCPFVREGDVRRDATMNDFRRLSMLAQAFPQLDTAGGVICEPNDTPLDSRHLDMIY